MTLLMPDPQEARDSGLTDNHSEYRVWWSENVLGLKVRRRARTIRPEPGALGVDAEDEG